MHLESCRAKLEHRAGTIGITYRRDPSRDMNRRKAGDPF